MASRWRSQQRKQRWAHTAVAVPQCLFELLEGEPSLSAFTQSLRQWSQLASTYDQVAGLKVLVDSLRKLVLASSVDVEDDDKKVDFQSHSSDGNERGGINHGVACLGLSVAVELLFQENSRPIHRTMLAAFAQLPVHFERAVCDAFVRCCGKYGLGGGAERPFALVGVGVSLANLPKPGVLKRVLQLCSTLIAVTISNDLKHTLHQSEEGQNLTPHVMEECQDAMSTLYYILQCFPNDLAKAYLKSGFTSSSMVEDASACGNGVAKGCKDSSEMDAYAAIVNVSLDILQTVCMSRDCIVAAGVCISAAAQLTTSNGELVLILATALFSSSGLQFTLPCSKDGLPTVPSTPGYFESTVFRQRGETLAVEIGKFTDFAKLCFFRGLLTAISRSTLNVFLLSSDNADLCKEQKMQPWSLLYNGILPAVCAICEGSFDSHFKFHGVTTMQICLQQIKASILGNLTTVSMEELKTTSMASGIFIKPYDPLPYSLIARVLQIVWNNWEDPLNQTVKQVQMVFDLVADIQALPNTTAVPTGSDACCTGSFLHQVASDLLAIGGYRKGRYVPLASIALRIGAKDLIDLKSDLLFQTMYAMSDDDVCCAASTFLKSFLERLRQDCWNSKGIMDGDLEFRHLWIPPVLAGLVSGNPRLRTNLNTYGLPVALQIDDEGMMLMLSFLLDDENEEYMSNQSLKNANGMPGALNMNQRVAAVISILKVARSLGLVCQGCLEQTETGERSFLISLKGQSVHVPLLILELALTHMEDGLRFDAAELVCLAPKTATMPSYLELSLLKLAIPLNMRCSSTAFRMKWTNLFKRFFSRVRTATERQLKVDSSLLLKIKDVTQNARGRVIQEVHDCKQHTVSIPEMEMFMQWLSNLLVSSLYPSAPYERKNMAMNLFDALINTWNLSEYLSQPTKRFSPFHSGMLSEGSTMVLLASVVDSWDHLREIAFRILIQYPTPLPGLKSHHSVEDIICWAKSLANSPKVRESDAGSLILRLVFRKYVCELCWLVKLHPKPEVQCPDGKQQCDARYAGYVIVQYIESLNDWLEEGILVGEKDLLKACRHSLVHGVLLTLRYTMEELVWTTAAVRASTTSLQLALARLFSLILRSTSLALWVVSADALSIQENGNEALPMGISDVETERQAEDEEEEEDELLAPTEQMIMVGCWLSMKEVSLLLGTIARQVPLSSCGDAYQSESNLLMADCSTIDNAAFHSQQPTALLDSEQLEAIGQHFLQVLLSMKHNGAIDKTRVGFIALCNRLLNSDDARLTKMPEKWLQQLMVHTDAKGQTVDDLIRRSAGIPAAFLALFLAEPDGTPKKLLPRALKWLIGVSRRHLSSIYLETDDHIEDFTTSQQAIIPLRKGFSSRDDSCNALKTRDEGVVPVVHAFNVMRVAFHDTNLATDTSGFCADAIISTIKAFSSRHWEIRNSATLAFTALVHRTVGFLNIHSSQSARRAITGFEFFHRYPALHSFLLQELSCATLELEHNLQLQGGNSAALSNRLHPSLAPVLIILSRLKPSTINTGVDDWLSPSPFIPYVMRCATQCNLKVRVLASNALAPLVPFESLLDIMLQLVKSMPYVHLGSIGRDGDTINWKQALSFNAIHGMLLQISSLLKSNCSAIPDVEKRKKIFLEVYEHVLIRSWLGSPRLCPCPLVITEFLNVVEGGLQLIQSCPKLLKHHILLIGKLQRLLLETCLKCLDHDQYNPWDANIIRLRSTAAELYFSNTFEGQGKAAQGLSREENGSVESFCEGAHFNSVLKKALSDDMYEVRLATLKVLRKTPGQTIESYKKLHLEVPNATYLNGDFFLPTFLIERLKVELHPRCMQRILQVLFRWTCITKECPLPVENVPRTFSPAHIHGSQSDWNSSIAIWKTLTKVYETTKLAKCKEYAIRCLGLWLNKIGKCFQQFINLGTLPNEAEMGDVICIWTRVVDKHSAPDQSVNSRRAVSEAIVASGVLEGIKWVSDLLTKQLSCQRGAMKEMVLDYSKMMLHLWFTSIKLLEDEDTVLRRELALAILDVANLLGVTSSAGNVQAQVERVIELSFDILTVHFGKWAYYSDMLAAFIAGEEMAFINIEDVDLVRRLFDKEIDNHHEEEVLSIQLCCLHLKRILYGLATPSRGSLQEERSSDQTGVPHTKFTISIGEKSRADYMQAWRRKFLNQALLCARWCLGVDGCTRWIGGITNHQHAFKFLYRNLSGLLTFCMPVNIEPTNEDIQELQAGFANISEILQKLHLNPVISNTFCKLLDAYESRIQVDFGGDAFKLAIGNTIYENFEPLFIVR